MNRNKSWNKKSKKVFTSRILYVTYSLYDADGLHALKPIQGPFRSFLPILYQYIDHFFPQSLG